MHNRRILRHRRLQTIVVDVSLFIQNGTVLAHIEDKGSKQTGTRKEHVRMKITLWCKIHEEAQYFRNRSGRKLIIRSYEEFDQVLEGWRETRGIESPAEIFHNS